MTRVFIADDHGIIRCGVKALFGDSFGFAMVGEAADGLAAVAGVLALRPDVAVFDYWMPGCDGLEAARRVRKEWPSARILIFSDCDSPMVACDAVACGVRGIVLKTDGEEHLVDAVHSLARGGRYFSPALADTVLEQMERPGVRRTRPSLTRREREVVRLIVEGMSNRKIAGALNLSLKTIETHRSSAMRKLHTSSVAGLVREAMRAQLVQP